MGNRPFVIGIAGGSGSGKSTIVQRLQAGRFGSQLSLIPHDAYYFSADQLPLLPSGQRNWDHPDSLETSLFVQHVHELLSGRTIERPMYDFACHCRSSITERVQPAPVLILEGILLLHDPQVRELIDLKVFVETPADLRLMRRTVRDLEERGRSPRCIAEQYETTVRPMHEQFVEPSRHHADIWIPWLRENPAGLALLESRISEAMRDLT